MTERLTSLGRLLPFDKNVFKEFVKLHTDGMTNADSIAQTVTDETALAVFDGIKLEELLELAILTTTQNIQNDIDYDKLATRLLLTKVYRYALSGYENTKSKDFLKLYQESFVQNIKKGVELGLLNEKMLKIVDLEKIAKDLDPTLDDNYKYIGLATAAKRYMKLDWDQNPLETPQFMWMRIGIWLAQTEKNPEEWAVKFYKKLAKLEYMSGGSTNVGAGTNYPVLSNCYILDTEDDTHSIFDNVKHIAFIGKATGGIGIAVTKLRAAGSPVKTNNTFSSGPIPFIKVMDTALKSIDRGGKKAGAMCIYMENWHLNFPDFLDLKQNAGDDYRRIRMADTAVYISDEFMKRVINSDKWYMFDPLETPELTEIYGSEFSKKYQEYCDKADRGEMKMFKIVPAREQMEMILTSLVSTSHPWLTWKDPINLRALNNNTGTIHSSNLCTEICLPQDRNNIAVCNLLYINLTPHFKLNPKAKKWQDNIDWKNLEESVRFGTRQLDNLVTVNQLNIQEAENSDEANRAVGMGIAGLSEVLELLGFAYDSQEAFEITDCMLEFVSYYTIDESAGLAQEHGSYKNFKGSMWSQGYVPYDTIEKLARDRVGNMLGNTSGISLMQDRSLTLDWDKLRKKVKKGMRNATTMAIAPNANTGLVMGTSPAIDPRFSQVFSRATRNGKFLDINHNLVLDLKKIGLWDKVKSQVIEHYGEIDKIAEIPDNLKAIYRTSFQISPYAYIEVASRAQKWVDQSMSRNMYLETRDIAEIMDIYIEAWRRGLKTTYYLHTKPRHSSEQSTVKVNKAHKINKVGFGAILSAKALGIEVEAKAEIATEMPRIEPLEEKQAVSVEMAEIRENEEIKGINNEVSFEIGKACPVDPAERANCDSCQ